MGSPRRQLSAAPGFLLWRSSQDRWRARGASPEFTSHEKHDAGGKVELTETRAADGRVAGTPCTAHGATGAEDGKRESPLQLQADAIAGVQLGAETEDDRKLPAVLAELIRTVTGAAEREHGEWEDLTARDAVDPTDVPILDREIVLDAEEAR